MQRHLSDHPDAPPRALFPEAQENVSGDEIELIMGFGGGRRFASFQGNRIRGLRFGGNGDAFFWQPPKPMATFAVSLVRDDAKDDAEMQQ